MEIIKSILLNKFEFPESGINSLVEEQATVKNFTTAVEDMASSDSKTNFIYFIGHGFTTPNKNPNPNDPEKMDSGLVFWDGNILDDHVNDLIAKFRKDTKNLLIFSQCYSGLSSDLRFKMRDDGTPETVKAKRDVKSKTVLISASANDQVSWSYTHGSAFALYFDRIIKEMEDRDSISFYDVMMRMRELYPKQKCTVSASFKINKNDNLINKKLHSFNLFRT